MNLKVLHLVMKLNINILKSTWLKCFPDNLQVFPFKTYSTVKSRRQMEEHPTSRRAYVKIFQFYAFSLSKWLFIASLLGLPSVAFPESFLLGILTMKNCSWKNAGERRILAGFISVFAIQCCMQDGNAFPYANRRATWPFDIVLSMTRIVEIACFP